MTQRASEITDLRDAASSLVFAAESPALTEMDRYLLSQAAAWVKRAIANYDAMKPEREP